MAKAGRSRPWVTALVPVALASKGRDAAAAVVATMGTHLRLPHYADMLARSGTEVDLKDLESTTRSLLEAGTFLFDTPEGVARGVSAYWEAGVDEVALNFTGVCNADGVQRALEELESTVAEARLQ